MMKKKYVAISLAVFVVLVIVSACFGAMGRPIKGLTKISIIFAMVVLIANSIYDIKAGREKSFCIIIIVIAALAAIVNMVALIMDFMGIQ